jgi:restriction endonuclease S subunit
MKLIKIAEISTGYSFRSKIKHDPKGDTKVIQMSDVDSYRGVLIDKLQSISNFKPRSERYFLTAGDVIMVSKGYNMNAYVVPDNLGKTVAVNSFIVLKPVINRILPNYLAWFLNSNRTQHFFREIAAGTNIPNLSIKALEALDVFLPSIDDQFLLSSLENLKKREVYLLQELAKKKEHLIDEFLQRKVDDLKLNNKD